MSREEEFQKIKRTVREFLILKAKAENRSFTEVLRELKEGLEERKMKRARNIKDGDQQEINRN